MLNTVELVTLYFIIRFSELSYYYYKIGVFGSEESEAVGGKVKLRLEVTAVFGGVGEGVMPLAEPERLPRVGN